jgi:hypothetical protein
LVLPRLYRRTKYSESTAKPAPGLNSQSNAGKAAVLLIGVRFKAAFEIVGFTRRHNKYGMRFRLYCGCLRNALTIASTAEPGLSADCRYWFSIDEFHDCAKDPFRRYVCDAGELLSAFLGWGHLSGNTVAALPPSSAYDFGFSGVADGTQTGTMRVTLSERDRNGKQLWSTSFDAIVRTDYRGKRTAEWVYNASSVFLATSPL